MNPDHQPTTEGNVAYQEAEDCRVTKIKEAINLGLWEKLPGDMTLRHAEKIACRVLVLVLDALRESEQQ